MSNKIEHKYLAAGFWAEFIVNWHGWERGKDSPACTGRRRQGETRAGTVDAFHTGPSTPLRGNGRVTAASTPSHAQGSAWARHFPGYALQLLWNKHSALLLPYLGCLFPSVPGVLAAGQQAAESEEEPEGKARLASEESFAL